MENSFYSHYSDNIKNTKNIEIIKSLMCCIRTNEIPIINNKPLKNYREIIQNIFNRWN